MKIFYNLQNKHLIAVPLRNGSSHLSTNSFTYKLTEVTYVPMFKSIISEVERKTFLYRDPSVRLLSFYNQFCYRPYAEKISNMEDAKLFIPKTRGNCLLSDFLNAKELLLKNYKLDRHTRPQAEYFYNEEYNQELDEYEIISTDEYVKWIYLTFGDKITHKVSSLKDTNITPINFRYMQKIQEFCKTLYKDDYELLEPKITYL